ncbi:cytochrome c oxidase subunit 2A [Heyndrickxia sp. MSNUG]|uniref:cytochrome c oxidase subunit 2A n=1 Tax=Bacillaceae TaxID=186817 RepID=UPI003C2F105C
MKAKDEVVQGKKGKVSTHETTKIGTWISVGIVGAVILATYFVLFGLYMARV